MTVATTTASVANPIRFPGSERIAAFAMGAAILLSSSTGANATGAVVSNSQPRINMLLVGSSRENSTTKARAASAISMFNAQDHIVSELARLIDGWGGEATLAPSADVQLDVAEVIAILNITSENMPEVHIDDDGATSLVWAIDSDRLLSLEFFGKGYVACTFAHKDPALSAFQKIDVQDEIAIASFLEAASAAGSLNSLV